jgi:ubiquinone/menaquinone biosynthesis C-methylase UbiE
MGSSDSYILKNVAIKKVKGEKYGIDFREPDICVPEVNYIVGNLLDTNLPTNFFKNITCLSVIEHEIDFTKFACEVSRILTNKGKIYITFDYWNPKIVSQIKLYGLSWQPLCQEDVEDLIHEFQSYDLCLLQEVNWSTDKAVITPENYSPDKNYSYTFGLLVFEKRSKET